MDVRIGKMLLFATLLGCTEHALTVAAALSAKSPFLPATGHGERRELMRPMQRRFLRYREYIAPSSSLNQQQQQQQSAEDCLDPYPDGDSVVHCRSDHIAAVHAFRLFKETLTKNGRSAAQAFCREYFLSFNALQEMDALRDYYRDFLVRSGFADQPPPPPSTETLARENRSCKGSTTTKRSNDTDIFGNRLSNSNSGKTFSEILIEDTAAQAIDRDLLRCALCAGTQDRNSTSSNNVSSLLALLCFAVSVGDDDLCVAVLLFDS